MTASLSFTVVVRETHVLKVNAPTEAAALDRAAEHWRVKRSDPDIRRAFPKTVEVFLADRAQTNDAQPINAQRASWAAAALMTFAGLTGSDIGPEALHDLLCDLGHWADAKGIDFAEAIERAAATWSDEKHLDEEEMI